MLACVLIVIVSQLLAEFIVRAISLYERNKGKGDALLDWPWDYVDTVGKRITWKE